jgi:hypothetical protein
VNVTWWKKTASHSQVIQNVYVDVTPWDNTSLLIYFSLLFVGYVGEVCDVVCGICLCYMPFSIEDLAFFM